MLKLIIVSLCLKSMSFPVGNIAIIRASRVVSTALGEIWSWFSVEEVVFVLGSQGVIISGTCFSKMTDSSPMSDNQADIDSGPTRLEEGHLSNAYLVENCVTTKTCISVSCNRNVVTDDGHGLIFKYRYGTYGHIECNKCREMEEFSNWLWKEFISKIRSDNEALKKGEASAGAGSKSVQPSSSDQFINQSQLNESFAEFERRLSLLRGQAGNPLGGISTMGPMGPQYSSFLTPATMWPMDPGMVCTQHCGPWKLHSTVTSLLHVTDRSLMNIDKGLMTGVVFIVLRKAFDTVDVNILLAKLPSFGIT